jgi:uncharacterized protein
MFITTIAYHAGMIAVDAIAIQKFSKLKKFPESIGTFVCWFIATLSLAILLGEKGFGRARLVSYGLSIHAIVILVCCSVLLQKTNKIVASICILIAILLSTISIYSFFVEPFKLEVTEYAIQSSKIKKPYKVAVISDFQADQFTKYEREVLKETQLAKPDLILMTGDYLQPIDKKQGLKLASEFTGYLQELRFSAPLGVYAVRGDTERPSWEHIFDSTSVRTFEQTDRFEIDGIKITALSRNDSKNVDLFVSESPSFQIVFGHSPNFALGNVNADLLIAGHTHGGQLRLPFFGPLYIKSKIPRRWGAGMTPLDHERTLIVSRGIGMERGYAPRFRFLCRPELVFVELKPISGR